MSFLKSLFGGGGNDNAPTPAKAVAEEDYKGFLIRATPMPVGSEHQLCGTISKEIGGETKSHRFVRADRLSTKEEAASLSLAKGRQLVDEQGARLFS